MASTTVAFDIIAHDRASGKFDALGRAADGSTKKMSKFNGMMKTAGKAAAYGLGAGLVIAAGAGVKFAQAAADDEAAAKLLEGQLKRNASATDEQVSATERWITAQGQALGVTDTELRPALGALVTATGDVGKAQQLAGLAMDVSAARGKSLKSVSEALMKAQNGNVAALSKLGINTKNAAGETITMEQATKRMADQFGGAAQEKAGTLQGKMDRLKTIMSETGESIGAKLLPVATKFADWILKKAIPAIEDFIAGMKDGTGPGGKFADALDKIKTAAQKAWPIVKNGIQFILDHKAEFATFAGVILSISAAVKVWRTAQLLLNIALYANPLGLVVATLALVAAGLVYAYRHSEKFRKIVDGAFRAVGAAGKWLWNNALQPAFQFIINGIGHIIEGAADMLDALSHVPGFGWAKDAADKMHNAASKAFELADNIKKIPDKKVVAIDVRIQGQYLLNHVENQIDRLEGRTRAIFKGGKAPKFEAFAAGTSIFGTDLSVEEGGAPKTVADILAAGAASQAEAQAVAADTAKLISMGLSDTLLRQLQEAGVAGAEQIHLLAAGTAADIATANAQQAATQAALKAAGVAVGEELAAGVFGPGGPKVPALADLKAKGGDTYNITVNGSLNGPQTARLIVTAIKTYKRVDMGGQVLGIA